MYSLFFYFYIKTLFILTWSGFMNYLFRTFLPISTLLCGNCSTNFKLRLYFYHSFYFEILLGRLLYSVFFIICANPNCVTNLISCKLHLLLISEIYFTYLVIYLSIAHTGKYHVLHLPVYLTLNIYDFQDFCFAKW